MKKEKMKAKTKTIVKTPSTQKTKKPTVKELKEQTASQKSKKTFQVLRGMHDVLPREEKYWKTLFNNSQKLAEHYQFNRIETPVLEEAGLFIRSLGKGTDVVEKEMYVFDLSDGKVCLRPEGTAPIARSYINAGMWNYPQPVKLWYWAPMFRHDRPQAGRYRQFFQVGFETIGVLDPASDAELILIAYNFYKDIGFPVEIRINSIGLPDERERYKAELSNYYRTKKSYLCDDCRKRLLKNPLRLLDCKQDQCQPIKDEAPQIVDWLSDNSKNYFMKVLEYLDELLVPYILQPSLVRGLDYYTHTVFEIFPAVEESEEGEEESKKKEKSQGALGGGGRYDLLIEEMAGRPTPAVGMALGIDRTVAVLKQYAEKYQLDLIKTSYDIFFAQLGDRAKGRALKMIEDLRQSGLKIGFNFFKNSLKNQLELANDLKVDYTLILGQKEVQEGTIIIRDMESGVQEIVDQKKVENLIKRKLKKFDDSGK